MKILLVTKKDKNEVYNNKIKRTKLVLTYQYPKLGGVKIIDSNEFNDFTDCTHVYYVDNSNYHKYNYLNLKRIYIDNKFKGLLYYKI